MLYIKENKAREIKYSQVHLGDQRDQDDLFVPVDRQTMSENFAHTTISLSENTTEFPISILITKPQGRRMLMMCSEKEIM